MTKFLTGIVAVALVQIAFGIYLSTERLEEMMWNAAAEATPVFDKTSDLSLASISENDLLTVDDSDIRPDRAAAVTAVLLRKDTNDVKQDPVRKIRRSSERSPQNYSVENASFRKPLKVVVSDPYAGKPSVERRSEVTETPKITPRSENRSFIAKAMPVIKKPYDWLKAVGSKLR